MPRTTDREFYTSVLEQAYLQSVRAEAEYLQHLCELDMAQDPDTDSSGSHSDSMSTDDDDALPIHLDPLINPPPGQVYLQGLEQLHNNYYLTDHQRITKPKDSK